MERCSKKLVAGREHTYFEHFWNDFAADPKHSVPEADRRFYAAACAQSGAMRAGFEVFRAFEQHAQDFEQFAQTKLTIPDVSPNRREGVGNFLIQQARLVDTDVQGVIIKRSGHWLMEDARAGYSSTGRIHKEFSVRASARRRKGAHYFRATEKWTAVA